MGVSFFFFFCGASGSDLISICPAVKLNWKCLLWETNLIDHIVIWYSIPQRLFIKEVPILFYWINCQPVKYYPHWMWTLCIMRKSLFSSFIHSATHTQNAELYTQINSHFYWRCHCCDAYCTCISYWPYWKNSVKYRSQLNLLFAFIVKSFSIRLWSLVWIKFIEIRFAFLAFIFQTLKTVFFLFRQQQQKPSKTFHIDSYCSLQ